MLQINDLVIMSILVVSPQVRYIEVFDITNPRFNEQIWPVPSDFVKSRFHYIVSVVSSTDNIARGLARDLQAGS